MRLQDLCAEVDWAMDQSVPLKRPLLFAVGTLSLYWQQDDAKALNGSEQ